MKETPASKLPALLVILALAGLLDALYLTIEHYANISQFCSIVGVGGCDLVTGSAYATLLGVPIALFGVLYYAGVLVLLLQYRGTGGTRAARLVLTLTGGATLVSLYLAYLQFFVIRALCPFCLVSGAISLLLFSGALCLRAKPGPSGSAPAPLPTEPEPPLSA